jgi:NitT/TauT family transport system permease protein
MSASTAALPQPAGAPGITANPALLRIAAPTLLGVVLLAVWQLVCTTFAVPEYLIPSPLRIAQTLAEDWALLSSALLTTLKITFLAFALAVVLGVAAAFVFVQSRILEISLFPYAVILQVTPIVAIAPLIIILVKNTQLALVICATIIAIFPVISNTTVGLRSVDKGHQDLFTINRSTRLQRLLYLRIPSALPFFFAGLRVSSGLALIGAVVAEFVAGTGGRNTGLAYEILQAGFQLEIPRMFAALFLITIAGIVLFLLMVALSKLALGSWHDSAVENET